MQHLQHIAELGPLLIRLKARHVIIAPGSRNAPLIQLFTANKAFNCYSIVDERVAGYVALGMARQLNEPVVIVTTSGTAVLNLAPAVTEAFHQNLALIILSADRPLEVIPQFNNQVIDQVAPFYTQSKGFLEFPLKIRSEMELKQTLSAFEQLICEATNSPCGPVHVNIPLSEPLYEILSNPILSSEDFNCEPYPEIEDSLSTESISPGSKILILAGVGSYTEELSSSLIELVRSGPVVLVAENISNLKADLFIANPELILASASEEEKLKLVPDILITFGGQVVSKRLKQFLQSLGDLEKRILEGNPLAGLKALANSRGMGQSNRENQYVLDWKNIEDRSIKNASQFMKDAPFCNLTSIQMVLDSMPQNTIVHLGNSSTIRYAQLVPVRQDLRYFSNRGTSGIDGCVSTAVGAAMVSDQLHVLLIGDLSFVYDSNALWNQNFPSNLRIIIMNDGGGGIFRLLDGPDGMDFFEEFSVTHHPVSLELLAQSFGRSFQKVSSSETLYAKLEILFQPDSSISILEVDTSRSENSRIFKAFLK